MQTRYKELLLKGAVWALAGTFIKYVLSFFVTVMIAKTYGVESFGMYQYILSLFAIVESVSLVVNYTMVQNDLIARRIAIHEVLGVIRGVSLSLSAVLVLVFLLLALIHGFSDHTFNLLLLIHLALLFKFSDAYLIGLNQNLRLSEVQKIDIVAIGLFNLMRVYWVWIEGSLEGLVLLTVVQYAMAGALAYHYFSQLRVQTEKPVFQLSLAVHLIKKGFPLYLIAVLAVFQARIVNVLLPSLLSTADLGVFAIASKVIDPIATICLLLVVTSYPILSHSFKNSPEDFYRKLEKLLGLSIPAIGAVIVLLALLPLAWLFSLLGKDFSRGGALLPILAVGILSQLIAYVSNMADALSQQFRFCLVRNLAVFILLLMLSVAGVAIAGLEGVAWAVVLAQMLAHVFINAMMPHGRKLNEALIKSLRLSNVSSAFSEAIHSVMKRGSK